MLAEGFTTRRGRHGAFLYHDAVNHIVRGRKGARLTAITSGGAIPDTADYQVMLEPEGHLVGTVNEDFAVESLAGDVFQLGNASYRIIRVERSIVRVEDARGEAPTIPFWLGEAPGRTDELSVAVSRLRDEMASRFDSQLEAGDRGLDGRARSASGHSHPAGRSCKQRVSGIPTAGPQPPAPSRGSQCSELAQARGRSRRIGRFAARGVLRRRSRCARLSADSAARSYSSASSTKRAACSSSFIRRLAAASIGRGVSRCASASAARSTSSCKRPRPKTRSFCL